MIRGPDAAQDDRMGWITLTRDHVWPIGITIALLLVVAVNVAFIVIAVRGQDE